MGLEIKKHRLAVALLLLLLIALVTLLFFAGVFTETPAKIESPAGFVEP